MGIALLILAVLFIVIGIVEIAHGALLFGLVLLVVGCALAAFTRGVPSRGL